MARSAQQEAGRYHSTVSQTYWLGWPNRRLAGTVAQSAKLSNLAGHQHSHPSLLAGSGWQKADIWQPLQSSLLAGSAQQIDGKYCSTFNQTYQPGRPREGWQTTQQHSQQSLLAESAQQKACAVSQVYWQSQPSTRLADTAAQSAKLMVLVGPAEHCQILQCSQSIFTILASPAESWRIVHNSRPNLPSGPGQQKADS